MDEEYGRPTREAKRRTPGGRGRGAKEGEHATRKPDRAIDRNGALNPEGFRSALLTHFDRHRRPLPWRTDRTPYRVLVSEFMLQQTRVETVVPYYERWLRRFPGWDSLAAATLDDVLLEWKGLGYYSRARNLHRTARAVRERHGGELPADPAALRSLPGIGEYTAGAVASIAFGHPVPAIDGNVRRVLARLLDLAAPTPAQLRRTASRLLDPKRPGDHNEAMMELGATICTPRSPRCDECPVAAWCAAHAAGTVSLRPAPPRRRPVPQADYATAVVLDTAGRTLLVKRPDGGLLAGMWEFPSTELRTPPATPGDPPTPTALHHLATLGVHGHPTTTLPPVRHAFTHLRATYHPIVILSGDTADPPHDPGDAAPSTNARTHPPTAWVHPTDLDDHALPVAQQRIGRLLRRWIAGTRPRASG